MAAAPLREPVRMVSKLLVISLALIVAGVVSLGAASTGEFDTQSCTPTYSGPPICFENPDPDPVYLGVVLVVAGLAFAGASLLRDPRKESYSAARAKKRGSSSSRTEVTSAAAESEIAKEEGPSATPSSAVEKNGKDPVKVEDKN